MTLLLVVLAAGLVGCATPNTGVVDIGNGVYMLARLGGPMTHSGGVVKAELFKEAAAHCAKSGKRLIPGDSTSRDAAPYTYASAEIQFRCS